MSDLLLTRSPALRGFLFRTLITLFAYGACIVLIWCSVALGLSHGSIAFIETPLLLLGPVSFYLLIRTSRTLRCKDPALTMWQMVFAVLNLSAAYGANPYIRSATLLIVALVMAFGMFSLKPIQARRLAFFTIVLYGVEMILLEQLWPLIYRPNEELINFFILAAVMPTLSTLSSQVARLRSSMREQRSNLEAAMVKLETLASLDELTGLVNRRSMTERLEREQLRRGEGPTCVCLIDLDHFKMINDKHGHAAGDETLRCFARTALSCLREVDVIARWGGEEFVLLMPDTDPESAGNALDRLREALALPGAWGGRKELMVTFSAGIAEWGNGQTVEQLVEQADREAYRAKTSGRDRWCCASRAPREQA